MFKKKTHKRANLTPAERESAARGWEEQSRQSFERARRTGDEMTLATARAQALEAEAARRGVDSFEELPADVRKKYDLDGVKAALGRWDAQRKR